MPIQEKCRILDHQKVGPRFYKLTLLSKYIATHAEPGQFVEVRCAAGYDPLLRRPLSFHKINPQHETFELFYEVIGKGTELLTKQTVGSELDVLGPLGSGFKIDPAKKVHILIGGGMGVAPLRALAEAIKGPGAGVQGPEKKTVYSLIGAKTKEYVQCESEIKTAADQVVVSTDDGSYGEKGLVSDLLLELFANSLPPTNYSLTTIYACGPKAMLKAVAEIAWQKQIDCQLSMEERMACGIGACKGCAVMTRSGYKMACKDGPVFAAAEVVWS
jgi:dihydroorotate dehydrogenase electron transfer subunit